MMMIHKLTVVIFALSILSLTYAQSVLGTEYPLGIQLHPSTGPSFALGGSGTGALNDFYGFSLNPANLGDISRATFSATLSFDFLRILDNNNHSNHLGASPGLLTFEFPLGKYGTLGFSVDQRSAKELSYLTRNVPIHGDSLDIVKSAQVGFLENGGTIAWQAGWGYNLFSHAYAGLSYERIYFNSAASLIKQTETGDLETLFDSTKTSWGGNGIRAGVLVPLHSLVLGLSGEYIFHDRGTHDSVLQEPGFRDSSVSTFMLHMPPSVNAGISYVFTPEWFAAADFSVTLWNRYFSELSLGKTVADAYSFSGGAQYIPAPNLLSPRYWEIMQYRAGFRYAQMPLSTASEYGLTLGVGLPIQQGGGLFDISIEYGQRSDNRFTDYKEEFLHVQLGINGGRKWTSNSAPSSY